FPAARFLAAPNHSYSRSVNLGVAALDTERVVLMNADVLVEQGTFTRLESALSSSGGAAVVAPLALTAAGQPQAMGLPYAWHHRRLRRARARAEVKPAAPGQTGAASVAVPWLAGYLQLMPRSVW